MTQKIVGHVVDEDGIEIEVWVDTDHVFLMYGSSQVGDFPLNQPQRNEVQQLANRVAKGEAKKLACVGKDAVIDEYDSFGSPNRTLHGRQTVH